MALGEDDAASESLLICNDAVSESLVEDLNQLKMLRLAAMFWLNRPVWASAAWSVPVFGVLTPLRLPAARLIARRRAWYIYGNTRCRLHELSALIDRSVM
jgi:hypothetical protein